MSNWKDLYYKGNFFPTKKEIAKSEKHTELNLSPVMSGEPNELGLYNLNDNAIELLVQGVYDKGDYKKNYYYTNGLGKDKKFSFIVDLDKKSKRIVGFRCALIFIDRN